VSGCGEKTGESGLNLVWVSASVWCTAAADGWGIDVIWESDMDSETVAGSSVGVTSGVVTCCLGKWKVLGRMFGLKLSHFIISKTI
jgi:hypothetical protein